MNNKYNCVCDVRERQREVPLLYGKLLFVRLIKLAGTLRERNNRESSD